MVATSLTEAEFYSSVTCGKIAKCLCCVLTALDALCPGPTHLFIDNVAALHMINEKHPTPHAQHIDIHHFAIQEWCKKKDLVMEHLPGFLNPSDDLTKPLGWVLHACHAHRSMGHYKIGSPFEASLFSHWLSTRMETQEAGEGDVPNSRATASPEVSKTWDS